MCYNESRYSRYSRDFRGQINFAKCMRLIFFLLYCKSFLLDWVLSDYGRGNSPGNNTGLVYAVDHFPSIGFTTHFYLSYKGTRLLQ